MVKILLMTRPAERKSILTLVPSTNTKDSRVRTTRVTISIVILGIDFYFCEYVSKLKSKDNFFILQVSDHVSSVNVEML